MSAPAVRVFYDADADPTRLRDRVVAVIGYGSQGHAHALNLRDSGVRVIVGLRPGGASWERARAEGLDVRPIADAAAAANVVMVLVPDQEARAVYEAGIARTLGPGKTLLFAHGFNIHFGEIVPPPSVDVAMIAPKSPGHMVRSEYQAGRGVPALVAVQRDASGHALADALAYAAGIGCTRAGVLETSFKEETETDLFGEQAVLCGGVTALVQAGFETLTNAGYAPEIAYFECLHELKLIVDLMYRGGMGFMRRSISDTAEYGDYTRGGTSGRSEEHTSELQSRSDLVCRLLLEKKKKKTHESDSVRFADAGKARNRAEEGAPIVAKRPAACISADGESSNAGIDLDSIDQIEYRA